MADQRDVEYNQISTNLCVLLDGLRLAAVLIVTHYTSPLAGPSASQTVGRRCVDTFFCVVTLANNHPGTALKSPGLTEGHPLDHPSNVLT